MGSISTGKKISKYEGNALPKESNETCFQNNIKVLLWFDLFLYVRIQKLQLKKWLTHVVEIAAKCIEVYRAKINKDTSQKII